MLGKRSRPVQKTASKLQLMPDYPSDSSPTRDHPEDKHKSSSFFNAPRLFIGFNPKVFTESDGVRSPTSPLDMKTLSGVGITFWQEKQLRSPRSGLEGLGSRSGSGSGSGSSRHWEKRDSEGIGLAIVAALHNSGSSSNDINGTISPKFSDGRKPLLGSQLKILVGSNQTQLSSPHTLLSSPKAQLVSPNIHLSSHKQLSPPGTPLKGSETLLSPPNNHLKSPQSQPSSFHKQSEPIPIGSPQGFAKSPVKNVMEHSESYTCVTSHGPKSSTKHIYAHCNMESETVQLPVQKREQEIWNIASPPSVNVPEFPTADFLSACYLCKRTLSHGKDIYMYRGDKAFCSVECRYQQILMDERTENYASSPPSSTASTSTCRGRIFSTSTAAVA